MDLEQFLRLECVRRTEIECHRCGTQMDEGHGRVHQRVCPQGVREERRAVILRVPGRYLQAISSEGRGRALKRQASTVPCSARPVAARPGPAVRGVPQNNPAWNPFVAQGP